MTLPSVVNLVGDDNLTFNTDYPHPDGTWPAGLENLEKQPIPQSSIRKIFWDNAAEVFGVQLGVVGWSFDSRRSWGNAGSDTL